MRESRIIWNTFQKSLRWIVAAGLGAGAGGAVAWSVAQEREKDPPMGQAIFVGDTVLRPYDPTPALVTKETRVDRAKYPATDIHAHWPASVEPAALLKAMDDLGVERSVNLSGGFGAQLDRMLARYHDASPGRLVIFGNIDFSRIDEPTFAADHVTMLERAHARGMAGVKIFKSLGLTIKDRSGRVVPIDDPRIDPIWEACGRLRIPVLIHSSDPVAFFQPIDEKNERWLQLKRHPDWSFHGPGFPAREEVLAQRDRMVAKHPKTTFIAAHLGDNGEDLAALARRLERHPNMVVDLSAREAEMGRQPYTARAFLIRWQDSVLFGTDRYPGRPDQPRHRLYYRLLETSDEYFKYYDHPFPTTGEWRVYGLHLPDDVLRKIYQSNADRVLGWKVEDR
ncbi:MAG: amidohydrolase [Acidobacteria bacterium]|nr:amidohydrolase [Acidobacteriota bacterium]